MLLTANALKILRLIQAAGSWSVEDVQKLGPGVGTRAIKHLIKMGQVTGRIVDIQVEIPADMFGPAHMKTFGEARYFVTDEGRKTLDAAKEKP